MADDPHDLLDQAEETVAEEVSAVLAEVADEFAREVADATELVAARFSVSRIARMFTDRMPRIVRRLLRVSETAAQQAADDTGGELPDTWEDLPGRYDDDRPLPPAMSTYVTTTEHLLRAVGDRLAEVARQELAAGVDAGEEIDQLRARLREAFAREGAQLGDVREERIARTEAGRAWNTATLGAARDVTGPDAIVKQWISQRDSRVRHDHKQANGQIRLLDERFTVGEARMDAPHDPIAPADQVVNCRCVLAVYPETRASAYGFQAAPSAGLSDPRLTAAAGEHTGAMIALVPSDENLARLTIDGGEPADEMHLTIWYLGQADVFPEHERASLIDLIREELADRGLGPVSARIFGVNRWNGNSDEPCWVYAVSDDTSDNRPPGSPYLHEVRDVAAYGLRQSELDHEQVPDQYSPWVAHVTAAYGDGDRLAELEDSLGPVTFDRVRVAFAGEYTDITLGSQQEEQAMPEQHAAASPVVAEPITTRAWSTPGDTAIAFENEQTGDGRMFAPGSLFWEKDPMPLQYADEMGMGHDGAELCGAINTVTRDGNRITASGVLYLNRYAGMDAVMLLEEEAPLGVSVDLDDVDVEFVDNTLDPEDADWLFASAHLAEASVLRMEDGSVMLSGASRAEWAASTGGHMARNRFDLQLITGPDGLVSAATIRTAFERSGVLSAAAGDPDDPNTGVVVHSEKSGDFLIRITRARLRGATLVAMPAYKRARIVLDPLEETASSNAPLVLTAASEAHERVVTFVCTSPTAVGAREVATALGISMSSARGHLGRAAKNGRIIRLAPGQYVGPSTLPEGHEEEATASTADRVVEGEFHGTKGRPSYRKYHPSGRNAASARKTQHAGGGWMGSNRFSVAQHEDAMLDYQGRAYRDMNNLLRSGADPQRATLEETRQQIAALEDLIMIQDPLSEEKALYRGTRQLRIGLKPGDVFHDRGFSSTSEDEDVASSMTGVGGSLFRITAPAGTQALSVTSFGGERSEAEFILPPGTQFRVTAANEPDDPLQTAVYDVEIINGRVASAELSVLRAAPTGITAAAVAQFEDRMSDWDKDTLVVDRRASAVPVDDDELVASAWTAMRQMPPMPAEWFREPTEEELPDGSGGVHYQDGRVFGFVATMDEPHAGYPGKNLTVRKLAAQGLDFTHFLRAKRQLDDGTTVRVGAMTMNVGHHRDGAECETSSCQFDDTRTVGAIITAGLSERGIWFSGAAAPWLSEWDRAVFQACQPSYHLKQGRDGKWQLRAVLTVPVPGHSTPLVAAIHAVAERSQLALAASAAGLLPAPDTLSGQDQDSVPAVSASPTDTSIDQRGQRPDTVSGQPVVDAAALAAALLTDAFVDRLIDAMALREAERRAEIEALQASLAITPAEITAAATPKEND